jgi:hypothetical protein
MIPVIIGSSAAGFSGKWHFIKKGGFHETGG